MKRNMSDEELTSCLYRTPAQRNIIVMDKKELITSLIATKYTANRINIHLLLPEGRTAIITIIPVKDVYKTKQVKYINRAIFQLRRVKAIDLFN